MIEGVFDRYGDPEVDQMVSMWRLVMKEEAKLFRGLPERFWVIPYFRLWEELMEAERSSDLHFVYIATMTTEEHTGVRIEAVKKIMFLLKNMDNWVVYVVDIQKKFSLLWIRWRRRSGIARWRLSTKGML